MWALLQGALGRERDSRTFGSLFSFEDGEIQAVRPDIKLNVTACRNGLGIMGIAMALPILLVRYRIDYVIICENLT